MRDGLNTEYYENGNKKSEGTYKNGKKVGKWKYWNAVGSEEGMYENDIKIGEWLESSGGGGARYSKKGNYVNGLRDGTWKVSRFTHFGMFRYLKKGNYKKGLKDGKWVKWYDKEKKFKKEEIVYSNGIEDGEYKEWYKSGYDKTLGTFKNGFREGKWSEWYLVEYGDRLDEMKEGWEYTGYIEGKKRLETEYQKGKQIGDSIEYDEGEQTVYEADY
jgi:antitoxin component YwqK of YwqJK toxin-antitoxin module